MIAHRAWLCDLDGTLYRPMGLKVLMAAELALLGQRDIATIRAFRREHERLREEYGQGLHGEAEVSPFELQIERAAVQLARDAAHVRRVVENWMIARPSRWLPRFRRASLLREIELFREAGGVTALVSDYPASAKLEALGASGLFDVVVASGEPGGPRTLKPDPAGYLAAANRLGVEPESCLVIGDRDDADGAAARAARMAFRQV